jgi:FtsZ-binding cell division protein ZapB
MGLARTKRTAAAPLLVAGLCVVFGGFAARAESSQSAAPASEASSGRYTMTPVPDGFLRLDTRSGQVSLCVLQNGQAQCRASADERAALQAEIDRLATENAALKTQGQKSQEPKVATEDEEDRRFDKALDRAERFVRRMIQLFRDPNGKPPPTSL